MYPVSFFNPVLLCKSCIFSLKSSSSLCFLIFLQGVSLGSVKIGMIGRTGVQPFSPMPVEGSVGSVGICIHSVGSVGGQSGHVSPPPPGVSPGVPRIVGVLPIGGGSAILSHCS